MRISKPGKYKTKGGSEVNVVPSDVEQFKWMSYRSMEDSTDKRDIFYYNDDGRAHFWSYRCEHFFVTAWNGYDLDEPVYKKALRPSKLATHMATAEVISKRSHDADTQVGAVLVKCDTETVIAQCYNGFVRGAPDEELPNTRPDKYEYMCHAEQNLITHCARHGISMENTYVVCTHSPCKVCMRMLWNAGVKKVIVKHKYKDFGEIVSMKDLKVVEVGDTPEGYIELRYEEV